MPGIQAKKRKASEAGLTVSDFVKRIYKERPAKKAEKPSRYEVLKQIQEANQAKKKKSKGRPKKPVEKRKSAPVGEIPKFNFVEPKIKEKEKEKDVHSEFARLYNSYLEAASIRPASLYGQSELDMKKNLIEKNVGLDIDLMIDGILYIRDQQVNINKVVLKQTGLLNILNKYRGGDRIGDPNVIAGDLAQIGGELASLIRENEGEKRELMEKNQGYERQLGELQAKLNIANENYTSLRVEKEKITTEKEELKGKMSSLEKEFNGIKREMKKNEDSIKLQTSELVEKEKELQEKAESLRQEYSQLDADYKEKEAKWKEIDIALEERRKEAYAWEEKTKACKASFDDYTLKIANQVKDIEQAKKTYESLQAAIAQKAKELDDASDLYKGKCKEYEAIIAQKAKELEDFKAKLPEFTMMRDQIAQLQVDNQAKQSQIAALKKQMEEMSQNANRQIQQAKGEGYAQAKQEIENAYISQFSVAQQQINEYKTIISNNIETIKVLQQKVSDYEGKLNQMDGEKNALQIALDNANKVISEKDAAITNLNVERANLERDNNILHARVQEAALQAARDKEKIIDLEATVAKFKRESIALKNEVSKLDAQVLKLESDKKALEDLIASQFVAPVPEAPQNVQDDDIEMPQAPIVGGDAISSIASALSSAQPLVSFESIKNLLYFVTPGARKVRSTIPAGRPVSAAERKRSLNQTSGAFLVGGRPDPDLGGKASQAYWKKAYKRSFRLF